MTPDRFARLREFFEQALALPPAERTAFVQRITAGDPAVGFELEHLLQAHEKSTEKASTASSGSQPRFTNHPPATDPSMVFGAYRAVRELGRGGMGTVYLALRADDTFRKTVALKVIRGGVDNEDFIRRFKQERQILAALDHPHIARILDGGATADNRPYFVMEYVEGSQIDVWCDRQRAGPAERVRLFLQVCSAVEYLHDNNVLHRDLKPGNILVDKHGHAKLLDFGIAKIQGLAGLPATRELSGAGPTMMMTPGYASPEQIEGKPATRASDVYSLGVILYELLTGTGPFLTADNTPNLAAQLAGVEPAAPSANLKDIEKRTAQTTGQYRKRLAGDLDRIVLKSLRRDPAMRYATAAEFAADLKRYLNGEPVAARTVPVLAKSGSGSRKLVVGGVAALLVALAGGGAWMGVRSRMAQERASARQAELARLLSLLESRVLPEASTSDQIADLRQASQMLTKDLPVLAASDVERSKALLRRILAYLDKVDAITRDHPTVREEIALLYQKATPVAAALNDLPFLEDQRKALASRRAAAAVPAEPDLAAQAASADRSTKRAPPENAPPVPASGGLAKPVVLEPRTAPSPVPASAAAPPREPAPAAAAPVQSASTVAPEEIRELQQRLSFATARLAQTSRAVEELRARLQKEGQQMRGDIPEALTRVESFLQMARADLAKSDAASARENLQRVEYELRRLARDVGQ